MIKFCYNWMTRIAILAGAFVFLQFPAFVRHYLAHLKGHVAELSNQLEALSRAAASVNKTLAEWIVKFSSSSDSDIAEQGKFLSSLLARQESFVAAETAIEASSLFTKPFQVLYHLDRDIAREAVSDYSLSLPINGEAAFYAAIGAVVGWLLFQALTLPFRISKKSPAAVEKR